MISRASLTSSTRLRGSGGLVAFAVVCAGWPLVAAVVEPVRAGQLERHAVPATGFPAQLATPQLAGQCYYYRWEFVDPVQQLLDDARITTSPQRLATGGRGVIGAAADGTAKLVIRVTLANRFESVPVHFSLDAADEAVGTTGIPTEDGSLTKIDAQTARANKVSVDSQDVDNVQHAFVIYNAPMDFVRNGTSDGANPTRDLSVTFRVDRDEQRCQVPIRITRPPVVLIHGTWSSPQIWDSFAPLNAPPSALSAGRFHVDRVDYSHVNAKSILEIVRVPGGGVQAQLQDRILTFKLREQVAAVKADVVAHSLGGLVARALPHLMGTQYLRPNNFKKGDIHKLITIDTPHTGTEWADLVKRAFDRQLTAGFIDRFTLLEKQFNAKLYWQGQAPIPKPLSDGAVFDQTTTSPLLRSMNLPGSVVNQPPIHTIYGIADIAQIVTNQVVWVQWFTMLTDGTRQGYRHIFGDLPHDLLVTTESQRGAGVFAGEALRETAVGGEPNGVSHSLDYLPAPGKARRSVIGPAAGVPTTSHVIRLLNVPLDAGLFWPKPPAGGNVRGGTTDDAQDAPMGLVTPTPALLVPAGALLPAETLRLAAMSLAAAQPPSYISGITITAPSAGTSVSAGDTVRVVVTPTSGFNITSVFVTAKDLPALEDAVPPFEFDVPIPVDAPLGPATIMAIAEDATGAFGIDTQHRPLHAEVQVTVGTSATLQSIRVDPESPWRFADLGLKRQVYVTGTFSDGVPRDLTLAPGTSFSSTNAAVAIVDRGGLVNPKGQGVATIAVSHAGHTGSIDVTVESANGPPVADAGSDQHVVAGAVVSLDGSGSRDPEQAPITYAWTLINRPDGSIAALTNPQSVSPSFTADVAGEYGVTLTVTDSHGAASVDLIVVTATASLPGDMDGDGLSDAWEVDFGTDPMSAQGHDGPLGDPDGDGANNATERDGGTHPRGFFTRYLAEGATGTFFRTRLALFNTHATTSGRTLVRFLTSEGDVRRMLLTIPPLARRTIDIEQVAGLSSANVSTTLEADTHVIVDRHMTWDASGYGSHGDPGVAAPATIWYLAEGSTSADFDLFYLLQNPNLVAVDVQVTYLRSLGLSPIVKSYTVPPLSRFNIYVDAEGPEFATMDVSAKFESTLPIVVERAMYKTGAGPAFSAGHSSAGVTSPALQWFLAEGATGPFFDLFVLVANPNDTPATIEVTYLLDAGASFSQHYTVPANNRFTIPVDGADPRLAHVSVSTIVRSTNNVPIAVERTMWWPGNFFEWYEAHNSPGATTTGARWAVAAGDVGGPAGTETFLLLANTSAWAGRARITVGFEDGTAPIVREIDVNAQRRHTIPFSTVFPETIGKRFGALVESLGSGPGSGKQAAQLVVELATYASPGGVPFAAGTNSLATRLP